MDLRLHSNQISDISPLEGLTNLAILQIYSNQISNISSLVNNPGLVISDNYNSLVATIEIPVLIVAILDYLDFITGGPDGYRQTGEDAYEADQDREDASRGRGQVGHGSEDGPALFEVEEVAKPGSS